MDKKMEMYGFSCIDTFPDGQKMERIHGEAFENIKSMQCFFFPSKAIKLELPQMPPYLALSTKITLSK